MLHHLVRSTADILSITAGGLAGGKIGAALAPLVIEKVSLSIAGLSQSQSQTNTSLTEFITAGARTYIADSYLEWCVKN